MSKETLVIGGRRSKLAVAQSNQVRTMIEEQHPQFECRVTALNTLGDEIQSKPLYSFGGKAVWTKELEDLLYYEDPDTRIDLIVHSLKDMPTLLPDGFELGCITKRVDPSDCLVMPLDSKYKTLDDLPDGSVVGTSSIRRSAQLKRRYSNLKFESVRGNIHTRLDKVDDKGSHYQCIILAAAGLVRMGLAHRITQKFDSSLMYHAVGQGALGIEIRKGDKMMLDILESISDRESTVRCLAERSLMRTLEGGCSVPIGVETVYNLDSKLLILKGIVVDVEGKEAIEQEHRMHIVNEKDDAIACGKILAEKMIAAGAKKILDGIKLETIQ